ncbi:hypothetical protein HanPSC8_Chr08g0310631 [Helianthus annuus]|nr:hypothetical protein HanPSC8_Chr08g0310631 [Helianthus annuus]
MKSQSGERRRSIMIVVNQIRVGVANGSCSWVQPDLNPTQTRKSCHTYQPEPNPNIRRLTRTFLFF